MTAHRASGIVASAVASAKQDGINYSEHVADRVLEAPEAKGLAITEKAEIERKRPSACDYTRAASERRTALERES